MNKKNQSAIVEDTDLQRAWHSYAVGNFYAARRWARKILRSPASAPQQQEQQQAAHIIAMSGVDLWVWVTGGLVALFSLFIAYVVTF